MGCTMSKELHPQHEKPRFQDPKADRLPRRTSHVYSSNNQVRGSTSSELNRRADEAASEACRCILQATSEVYPARHGDITQQAVSARKKKKEKHVTFEDYPARKR